MVADHRRLYAELLDDGSAEVIPLRPGQRPGRDAASVSGSTP
jgi:hypothetical protein